MDLYTREQTQTDVSDDPRARELLHEAFDKTARWQADFGGFQADLKVNVNGTESKGTVTVKGPRDVTVSLADPDLQKWAANQIGMMALHRGYRSFDEADGKYSLTLGGNGAHPLGQELLIHGDGMNSRYRLKDGRITQINRKLPHVAFTINVEEAAVTPEGKHLTTRYSVYYMSPQDGKLQNVDSVTDTHTRIGSADLPAFRRVLSFDQGEVAAKTMAFENHTLL